MVDSNILYAATEIFAGWLGQTDLREIKLN
jgi:hypothetical protein